MELKLSLFVHGVPNGQKVWGPKEADLVFIENFYGRKSNVDVQLLVDVFETNGSASCYYTFLRSGKVLDKDGRAGSYFALTIRLNAYYADLFNIYNILHAAYQKLILGTILNDSGTAINFIINDFNQVDGHLQNVEKEIRKYLSSFSLGTDLIGLNGFAVNASSQPGTISLIDCNNKNVLAHVKAKGNISVSPLYPTSQFAEHTRKKEEELESVKRQINQQIAEVKNKSEQEIQVLKNEYASADKIINDLKKESSSKEKKLNEVNAILTEIKQSLNGIDGKNHRTSKEPKNEEPKSHTNLILSFGIIATLLFQIIILYFMLHPPLSHTDPNIDPTSSKIQSENLDSNVNLGQEPPQSKALNIVRIDIEEFKNGVSMMTKGRPYHIQPDVQKGNWITSDFDFNADSTIVSPARVGECKIEYSIDNQIIGSRMITVKQ